MNYWLHRISHHSELSYNLLKRGYISIGFSIFSSEEFLSEVIKGDTSWGYFDKKFFGVFGTKKRSRYSLWRFLAKFKKGDIILVPFWGNFSIYEIDGEPILPSQIEVDGLKDIDQNEIYIKDGLFHRNIQNEETIDIGFLIRVKPIVTDICRYEYSDNRLNGRMKIHQINVDISDLEASIKNAINPNPSYIYTNVIEDIILPFYNAINSELDDSKIEQLVKWYFKKIGADSVTKLPKNEFGVVDYADGDIVATFDAIRTVIYVQAKHHKYETEGWVTKQITNYRDQKNIFDSEYTYISWIISTDYDFSEELKLQASVAGVRLINGRDLSRMLINAGIYKIDDAFISDLSATE